MAIHSRDSCLERTRVGETVIREYLPQLVTATFLFAFATAGSVYHAESEDGKREIWGKWAAVVSGKKSSTHESFNSTVVESENETSREVVWSNTTEREDQTVLLPPAKLTVWATSLLWAAGGFYLAAGIAAFIHRTRPGE